MSLVSGYELKEFDTASLTGSYQNLGSALSNPAYYAVIVNDSDVDVYISTDGSTDHFRIPSGATLPFSTYPRHNLKTLAACLFKNGTQLEIKQVTGTGTGYISINLLTMR